ncbi:hypothetical protein AB0L82_35715 [Nocardia sp. NPDC052001]|uniref:hypothetical protein n=1 Tax=Nocardia sp. NPDC052001 TaxID=3154853 RepID=UPI003415408F
MAVARDELIVDYTVVADDAQVIMSGAHALYPDAKDRLWRAGVNLASAAIERWRQPGIVERARTAPYPQLHAPLDAVGHAPVHVDSDENWSFEMTFGRHIWLDELLIGG